MTDTERWHYLVRKYRAKYRTEKAKRAATQEALVLMVKSLADSIQGELKVIEEEWPTVPPNGRAN